MTPQTVNAYYHPMLNEIVFPAAILQPPFFTAEADDAVNYGGIGAIIGHEIGHGFDDQGSQFDGSGALRNWWSEEDRKAFEGLAAKLVAQFDALAPYAAPEHKVNGKLTLGENIGDLGGLTIAYKAYLLSLDGAEPPVLEGLTRPAALLHVLGCRLAPGHPSRGSHPARRHGPALPQRVPDQCHRQEPGLVPRGVRGGSRGWNVAVARGPRQYLVGSGNSYLATSAGLTAWHFTSPAVCLTTSDGTEATPYLVPESKSLPM